jgi:hypothetical protein
MLIGYGIAAFIVLVLLIVFNVRAASNRSRRKSKAEENPPIEAAVKPLPEANPPTAVRKGRTGTGDQDYRNTGDQDYRNALRRLKSGQDGQPIGPKAVKKTPDEEYREAMRNLRKSRDHKD